MVTVDGEKTGWDVLLIDPDDPGEAKPVLNGRFDESSPRVSTDGRLLAFVSNEAGRNEVYVQPFPETGGKVQVSLDGGVQPVWRPGTRELLYRGSGKIMSVTLGPGSPPSVSAPHALFDDRLPGLNEPDHTAFAVERDGSLLGVEEPDPPDSGPPHRPQLDQGCGSGSVGIPCGLARGRARGSSPGARPS